MARLTDHNVVGTFPDLDRAREVLQDLSRSGVDADDISLLGKSVEDVTSDPDTRLRDLESTTDLMKNTAQKGALGSVIGGVVGAAAFVIPGAGPVIGAGIWAAAAGGAIAGGVVGGMVGAIGATELGPEWEVTYGTALNNGSALVAVHASSDAEARKAVAVFEKHGPERVDHIGATGTPLEAERR